MLQAQYLTRPVQKKETRLLCGPIFLRGIFLPVAPLGLHIGLLHGEHECVHVLLRHLAAGKKTCPIPDLEDLANAARYVQRPEATADGRFVTGINCLAETAVQQMQLTKEQYHKTGGYIAWHGYQSFKPGEVTPEECHQIGVETAQHLWGDRFQVLDRHHLHNHFILNSVSFVDGKKYNYSKQELYHHHSVRCAPQSCALRWAICICIKNANSR